MPFACSSFSPYERTKVRVKASKKVHTITLVYENNLTRTVKVKASSREIAERRALKRNPNALGVQRSA